MAVPIEEFSIIEVRKPNVGEHKPAGVEADIIIDTKGQPFCLTPRNLLASSSPTAYCGIGLLFLIKGSKSWPAVAFSVA